MLIFRLFQWFQMWNLWKRFEKKKKGWKRLKKWSKYTTISPKKALKRSFHPCDPYEELPLNPQCHPLSLENLKQDFFYDLLWKFCLISWTRFTLGPPHRNSSTLAFYYLLKVNAQFHHFCRLNFTASQIFQLKFYIFEFI